MLKSLLTKARMLCMLIACLMSSLIVSAQTKITGKVISSDDRLPVIGASVRIKGTTTGAVTNANGEFTLTAKLNDLLLITFIGYQDLQVKVSGTALGNIILKSTSSTLNEVVVTGYSSQRKKDISGAVSVVDISSAKKIVTGGSSEQLLQGQAAGVTVITSGAPGQGSNIFVRGVNNFGNTTPLFVIDGVQTGGMSDLSPNDIESIQVLKDAGSAAIYGVAGGNGVVVITTKKGKTGRSVLSYDAFYGSTRPAGGNPFNLLDSKGMSNLLYAVGDSVRAKKLYPDGPGTIPTYGYHGPTTSGVTNDESILSQYNFDASNPANDFLIMKFNQKGTDWYHELFKPATTQSHTLSATGGNDKNAYYLSANYLDQKGTLVDTYVKRYSGRVNTTFNIKDHVRIGENAYYFYRQTPYQGFNNQNESNPIGNLFISPTIPVRDIAGNYAGTFDTPGGEPLGTSTNPVAQQDRTKNNINRNWNLLGNLFVEADVFKYFTLRSSIGVNVNNSYYTQINYNPYDAYESHNNSNGYQEATSYYSSYDWVNQINYHQVFGKSNLSVVAGYEQKSGYGRFNSSSSANLFSVDPNYVNIGAGTTGLTAASGQNQLTRTASLFAKVDYIFNDRYIIGGTIRRDGYSAFYPGHQWGTFPAGSVAWRVSQENFMKGTTTWLSDLKLRGSYGEAGANANISGANAYSSYASLPGSSYYPIGGGNTITQGFYQNQLGNKKTTWETDKIANIGLDISLFNRIDLSVEYYEKKISGLLFQESLTAATGGAAPPYVNNGDVQNKGLDFSGTYHASTGKDFSYSIGINVTTYKNKITNIPGGYFGINQIHYSGDYIVRNQDNHAISEFFGYKTAGFYQNAADLASSPKYVGAQVGSFKYVDINGDNKIDANDRTFIGNPNPDFTYGVNLSANYKSFDFSMVLYGSQGNQDFNATLYYTDFYNTFPTVKSNDVLHNSFSSAGVTNPRLPIQTDNTSLGTNAISSFYVSNASFLKCRSMQLGYSFTPLTLSKIGINKLRVYVQGANLFTITPYKGLDPELVPQQGGANASASFGIDYGAYPNNEKRYIVGISASF